MAYEETRPRGILTTSDRRLLLGNIEYENKQQYSNRRQDIRERIANGLLDFGLIKYQLQDKDRKRIFQDPDGEAGVENAAFAESIGAMLYWTYLGLKEQNYDFEGLLVNALEQAEEDFARKYWGERVEADVQFGVDIDRSHDIDDVITAIESGGPVPADWLYDLLQMSSGVPIDPSELDTVRIWFRSSYPEGEKAVIETLFSDYLGVDVKVEEMQARAEVEGSEKESAVIDSEISRPDPSEIKGYRTATSVDWDEDDIIAMKALSNDDGNQTTKNAELNEKESVLDFILEEQIENDASPTISDLISKRDESEACVDPVSSDKVADLLDRVDDKVVSTTEVSKALGCAPEAARQALSELAEEFQVNRRAVLNNEGNQTIVWWLSDGQD